jgi:casein kinase I family protein HRR25
LESLAYVLLYFLWGFLPWQGLGCDGQAILESKQGITKEAIFQTLPREFRDFLEYSCSLSFEGKPDYDRFHALFSCLLLQNACQGDMAFDWDVADEKVPSRGAR